MCGSFVGDFFEGEISEYFGVGERKAIEVRARQRPAVAQRRAFSRHAPEHRVAVNIRAIKEIAGI